MGTISGEFMQRWSIAPIDQHIFQAVMLHSTLDWVKLPWKVSLKLLLAKYQHHFLINPCSDAVLHPGWVKLPWKLRDASAAAPPWSAAFVRKCICEEETGIFNSDRCCFLWQGVMERTSCCMHMQAINWKSIILFCEREDIQNLYDLSHWYCSSFSDLPVLLKKGKHFLQSDPKFTTRC